MVRLLRVVNEEKTFDLGFNPTMVRLLHFKLYNPADPQGCFNPTMVRLLQCPFALNGGDVVGFNPTMVRLLLSD